MKNKTTDLFFKYEIKDFKGKDYKAGYAYKLTFNQVDIERLLRQGCIYAAKDAKYYQEQKKEDKKIVDEVKTKPASVIVEEPKETKQDVKKDVDNKNIEQTKIQTGSTETTKFNK